ncbi:MAG TPA: hypothetical protein VGL75_04455 [Acidothermaceae bacterium]|jgi:hypothetical protein
MSREHTNAAADRAALEAYLEAHRAGNEYLLAGMRQLFTKNSQPLLGAEPFPVGTNSNAKVKLATVGGRIVGFALKETTGIATAEIDLIDGKNANDGDLLIPITLAPGESVRDWYGPAGVSFVAGLVASVVSGSVTGTVWLGRIDS